MLWQGFGAAQIRLRILVPIAVLALPSVHSISVVTGTTQTWRLRAPDMIPLFVQSPTAAPRLSLLNCTDGVHLMASAATGGVEGQTQNQPTTLHRGRQLAGWLTKTPIALASIIAQNLVKGASVLGSAGEKLLAKTEAIPLVGGKPVPMCGLLAGASILSSENARRTVYFWTNAFPMYVHYKVLSWVLRDKTKAERVARFAVLHDMYADKMLQIFHTLGGFYLKIGQNGANRVDFVPKQFTDRLKTLENEVPVERDPDFASKLVQRELGCKLEQVFKSFERESMGSASIGQCHRAELLDGRPVVVKVMRPNAERLFRGDLDTLDTFCKLAQPHICPVFDEFRRQFATEFNYTREAANLHLMRGSLSSKWQTTVCIPEPIDSLCTKNVLVMEYLPGVKLVDAMQEQAQREADRRGVTVTQIETEYLEKLRRPPGCMTAVSASVENAQLAAYRSMLTLRDALINTPALLGRSFGLSTSKYEQSKMPVDRERILSTLLKVHADQLFEHGCINGDPHPGNILLMPSGKLGLIDFGQVKTLTLEQRLLYASLIVALAERDTYKIITIYQQMGCKTKRSNPAVIAAWATVLNDRDDSSVLEGHNFQEFMELLNSRDPLTAAPEAFVMVQRANVLLRGCGHALGRQLSVAKEWYSTAKALLTRHKKLVLEQARLRSPPPPALVICGPSGVGKGTIINSLMKERGEMLGFSVSHTTRNPRPGETPGVSYHFTTKNEMQRRINKGEFLEHAHVHGNIYGTSLHAVRDVTSTGRVCVLDIDVQGVRACRASGLDGVYVFIAPPDQRELERRLRNRGTETEEQVERRLANAKAEMAAAVEPGLFDHVVTNNNLRKAVKDVEAIVFADPDQSSPAA